MRKSHSIVVMLAIGSIFCLTLLEGAPYQEEKDNIWKSYTAWIRTNPESTTLKAYGESLVAQGMSPEDVQAHLETIRGLFKEDALRSIEITYDRFFSKPLTGDMDTDGFTSLPSAYLMESLNKLDSKGRALDVGTGQGRNAVWLAKLHSALRPGGRLVFEHVLKTPEQQFPAYVQSIPPNSLLDYFEDFFIQYYEEGVWQGDWGGPPAELVRMIAKKISD